jgi:hypothetical protein
MEDLDKTKLSENFDVPHSNPQKAYIYMQFLMFSVNHINQFIQVQYRRLT